MIRPIAFCAGLALAHMAHAAEPGDYYTVQYANSVIAGNLAKPYPAPYHRAPDCIKRRVAGCIAYGNLPHRRGYERDHFISLCLLGEDVAARDPTRPPGPDNPGNVWFQPYPQARLKNGNEDMLCDEYRHGKITLEQAWRILRDRWGR